MDNESNNGLYFIVGGLLVVAVLGFLFVYNNEPDFSELAPSAGDSAPVVNQTSESTSTEFRVDDDGVSSTTTRTNSND